jgi:predicted GNAT family N-acyltransferase
MVQTASHLIDLEKKITQNHFENDIENTFREYMKNISKYNISPNNQNIKVIDSFDEFLQMSKLRSLVFSKVDGFNDEFPEEISGIQYDKFDKNSINLIYKIDKEVSGTLRVILNEKEGLQSQEYLPEFNKNVCEFSRLASSIKYRDRHISTQLINECFTISKSIGLEKIVALAEARLFKKSLTKLGFEKIETFDRYGKIEIPTTYGIKEL